MPGSPATTASGLVLRGTSGTLARIASTSLGVGSAVVAGGVTAMKVEDGSVSAVYVEVRQRIRPCVVGLTCKPFCMFCRCFGCL
jgi:hypothetical protein